MYCWSWGHKATSILLILLVLTSCFEAHKREEEDDVEHYNELPSESENIVEDYPYYEHEGTVISPTASTKDKWILSHDVGYFLQLPLIHTVKIPIKVNLVLIGLDGEGDQVPLPQTETWLSHVDHILEHLVVPIGEEYSSFNPKASPIQYLFSFQIIKVCPLVTTVLEDTLYWHLRPENPDYNHSNEKEETVHYENSPQRFYVDAFKVSGVLSSLLDYMGLGNDHYTLFLLNPRSPVPDEGAIYGYRVGFSEKELRKIFLNSLITFPNDPTITTPHASHSTPSLTQKETLETKKIREDLNKDRDWWIRNESGSSKKFEDLDLGKNLVVESKDFTHESENWAKEFLKQQLKDRPVSSVQNICNMGDAEEEDSVECLVIKLSKSTVDRDLNRVGLDIIDLAKYIIANGTGYEKRYLYAAHNTPQMGEECLVDSWVSHQRFAFVDMNAGPFEWGPGVGGEGLKTKKTIPKLPGKPKPSYKSSQPSIDVPLQNANEEEEEVEIPLVPQLPSEKLVEKLSDELKILTARVETACSNLDSDPGFCYLLNKRRDEITRKIALYRDSIDKKKIPVEEKWKYSNMEFTGELGEDIESKQGEPIPVEQFLASVGALISSSLRYLVVPPTPVFPLFSPNRITFQVTIISNHKTYDPRHPLSFDYDAFKHEILKFKLPNQEFTFSYRNLSMGEDPALALAFSSALKAASIPVISRKPCLINEECSLEEGIQIGSESVFYIDSGEIQQQLKKMQKPLRSLENHDDSLEAGFSKNIPIFIFSLDQALPVFVDKYYQSKALHNMIIGVQSRHINWESKVWCNGKPLKLNLRSPLRPVLSSTLSLLGGLVPAHLSFNPAIGSSCQEWEWSSGDNPLSSLTSSWGQWSTHFNSHQRDVSWRNIFVSSLERSIHSINRGLDLLDDNPTSMENLASLPFLPLDNLTDTYMGARKLWSSGVRAIVNGDYELAILLAKESEILSSKFESMCAKTADIMDFIQCFETKEEEKKEKSFSETEIAVTFDPEESFSFSRIKKMKWVAPVSLAFDVLLVLACCYIRKPKKKIKIN